MLRKSNTLNSAKPVFLVRSSSWGRTHKDQQFDNGGDEAEQTDAAKSSFSELLENEPLFRDSKMAYVSNWVRYMAHKLEYSLTLSLKKYTREKLSERELIGVVVKNLLYGRITYLHTGKGPEMAPTMGTHDNTLLVRKLPVVDTRYVSIGDAVVLKDPNETSKYLVRRLAAIEGAEMVSSDEKDEPFVLEKDQCWVVAENQEMKSKEAYDSRTFGPVSMTDIVGRAIYCLRTAVDHGPVSNSEFAMEEDSPILAVELDVDEMAKDHKAE